MNSMLPILRRRAIEETDLEAVVALLASGFAAHPAAWWRCGLERMRVRRSPHGYPRYGRLLEIDKRVVGALLTIHAEIPDGAGGSFVRCNLSSWHVEPAFAGHAPLLLGAALRDRSLTTINITPAPHTRPIIEAQGFSPFTAGSLATVPMLARRGERAGVRSLGTAAAASTWHDAGLLADHAALGCLCVVVDADDGAHPFVFSRPRKLHRLCPATQLLYCRDISAYVRFAGALGTALLRHGVPLALVDGVERLPGVPGRLINVQQKKYVVGPHPPRPGDLAYTELAIFG